MAVPIGKLAPTAVVIAAVTCCGWPYVFSSDAAGKKAAAMPEIAPAQLLPRILPPPARDPFLPAGAPVASLSKSAKPAKPAKTVPALAAGSKGVITSRSVSATGGKPHTSTDPLGGLKLTATSILADQRLAVINGRIYAERERIKSKDPSAPPCVVARILSDCVLLECDGRMAILSYVNLVVEPKANHAGGVVAPPGRGAPPAGPHTAGATARPGDSTARAEP